jgi:hypothetical protein
MAIICNFRHEKISILFVLVFQMAILHSQTAVRKKLSMDNCWRFYLGDIPMPVIKGHGMSYGAVKAGEAWVQTLQILMILNGGLERNVIINRVE